MPPARRAMPRSRPGKARRLPSARGKPYTARVMRPSLARIREELAFLYGRAAASSVGDGVRSLLER